MTPEERDDAAQEPETNDTPEAEGQAPDAEEGQEPDAVPGEAGEAAPEADEPATDEPVAEEPAEEAEEPVAEAEEPATDEEPAAEAAEGAPDEAAAERERARGGRPDSDKKPAEEELIPGAHLEPDLVLEEEQRPQSEFGEYAEVDETGEETGEGETAGEAGTDAAPVAHEPIALAADARYAATGKRKRAVARVILKPGEGTYTINSRHLDEYFPRVRLQRMARQPLEATGYQTRMDVVARIHGGGVSAQATALRHGVARALVEADPALRGELKRRGYLTRDPRVKERKKAGLKKARKRPQFSKR